MRHRWCMKLLKITVLLLSILVGMTTFVSGEESTSVYDAIENKQEGGLTEDQHGQHGHSTPENETSFSIIPFIVRLIVSLTFIILLIFIVLKFWAERVKGMQEKGPFLMLGGCVFGGNRSLQ